MKPLTRRLILGSLALGSTCLRAADKGARLSARPKGGAANIAAGLKPLGLRSDRDALLYVPSSSAQFEQAPLVVSLHGATRNADRGIELFRSLSDQLGFLLLAPASSDGT